MTDVDTNPNLSESQVPDSGATAPPAASTTGDSAPPPTQDATGEAAATTGKQDEPEWFQKRINQISRQRGHEARRADRAEARLAALERELQELRTSPPKAAELRPQDFPNYEAFVAATAAQSAKEAARAELAAGLRSRTEQETAHAARSRVESFLAKATPQAEAAGVDMEAVMETLQQAPNLSQTVADYLFTQTAIPAQLAEYLAENPAELDRISRLGPALAERSLAKVEASLGAKKPAPTVTNAPPPGPHATGRAVHVRNWRESDDMEEYAAAWLKAQEERAKLG